MTQLTFEQLVAIQPDFEPPLPGGAAYLVMLLSGTVILLAACLYCLLHGFESQPFFFDARLTLEWAMPRWGAWPWLLPVCYFVLRITHLRSSLLYALLASVTFAALGSTAFASVAGAVLGSDKTLFDWAYHQSPIAIATLLLAYGAGYLAISKRQRHLESGPGLHEGNGRKLSVWKGKVKTSIELDDIEWARAARNYVELAAGGSMFIRRSSLAEVERLGTPQRLLRVHRSYLVRPDRVTGAKGGRSRPRLIMASGDAIPVGRTYQNEAFKLLRSHNIHP